MISRRRLLRDAACGFGALAFSGLRHAEALAVDPLAPRRPHHAARAKRMIFLFMQGGVSHVDSYDYKPRLEKDDGKMMSFDDARTVANTGQRGTSQRVMKPLWSFARHGQSGRWGSTLFPEINRHVDDLTFVHSMHTDGVAHGPATLFLHTGSTNLIRPSMGSWVTYGLGTENGNLPGFVSIAPSSGNGGARNYGNAFLPAIYQGTALGRAGGPASEATIRDLAGLPEDERRRRFDLLQELNAEQLKRTPGESEYEAAVNSYELAWRMQGYAPDVLDLSRETKETLDLYGIGSKPTDNFGKQCLLARRLCESGVRFIQVTYGDNSANPAWDQHSNLPKHGEHARAVDRPISGLLSDLKRRGLLEDTIVWWGGEFGRTPYAEKNGTGRDHNPGGFTTWLAGAGLKAGLAHGATDEFGASAVEDRVHMHDLHATLLHLMGMDHEKLTYRYAGRDFRLTDVHGHVVKEILRVSVVLALLLSQQVSADFAGGSVEVEKIDGALLRVKPAAHPERGWDCWWYFKATGLPAGAITLDVGGGVWATPDRAAWSLDGKTWKQTPPGERAEKNRIRYAVEVGASEAWFAWGPPFVLADAAAAVTAAERSCVDAKVFELCKSRGGRSVPAVRIRGDGVAEAERRRVWVHARQHAWESGGSWVCRGFLEWLSSESAAEFRKRAEVVVVPVMDADNVEGGAGGKNQLPQDHNRDWSEGPHWPEVKAAQEGIRAMAAKGRFDLFVDLHNPGASDREPYYYVPPPELLTPESTAGLERLIVLSKEEIRGGLAYKGKRLESGAAYDKNWQRISKNWVARAVPTSVAVTLETSWNTPASTAEGYLEVGRGLGRAIDRLLR